MSDQNGARQGKPRTVFHGKLNLEQQKKRARELLKALDKSDPAALSRCAEHHPRWPLSEFRLSDTQLVLARENGFASWPAMKAHIDTLTDDSLLPDDAGVVHIRCGSDIAHGLQLAGFNGEFLEFSDPYCMGPVRDLPEPAFIEMRNAFLAEAFNLSINDIRARQQTSYQRLNQLKGAKVVLWFEHDSYDQLILAYLLNRFAELEYETLEMICVDRVPGVEDFVGLGQLSPELLRYLWHNERKQVTAEQLQLGKTAWAAICHKDQISLRELVATGTPALPLMSGALKRHLQELPDPDTGLSLTELLILQLLSDQPDIKAGPLFGRYMREVEPLPWLGDLMFWHILKTMAAGEMPVITIIEDDQEWHRYPVRITEDGQQVLAGKLNYLALMAKPRWVGGICINPVDAR